MHTHYHELTKAQTITVRRSAPRSGGGFILLLTLAGVLAGSLPTRADSPPALIFSIGPNAVPGGVFTPGCVAVDSSNFIYATDLALNRVVKFAPNGSYLGQWGRPVISLLQGIAVDTSNNVYVADNNSARIYKFTSNGLLRTQWGSRGSAPGQFGFLQGLALDRSNHLYVADGGNDRVEKFTTTGAYLGQYTGFYAANGVAINSSNDLYLLYYGNVQVFSSSGAPLTNWGAYATAIAIDPSDNVYVGDAGGFVKYTRDGIYLTQVGSPQQSGGVSGQVSGIAFDATGNFVYHATGATIEVYAYSASGPPLIYSQPSSQTVLAGANVTLSAGVFGGVPLTYQWLFNGTNLPGATSVSLTLSNLSLAQAGIYALQASNSIGSAVSSNALLVVEPAFVATQSPFVTSSTSALLNGMVTPGAQQTTAWFEWGTNSSYGNSAGMTVVAAAPDGSVRFVQAALAGLSVDYVYHYRLVSSNSSGITYGAAQQFTVGRKVFGWGDNTYGEISVPGDWSDVVAIAAGGADSLALRNGGTVVAWGLNNVGQTNVPQGLSNVVAITADGIHSLGLKGDGTVVAWGSYSGTPTGLSNVVAISPNLALKRDGTLVGWGDYGQVTVVADQGNVVAIAGNSSFNLALKNDGTVLAWGDNYYGESIVPANLSNVVAIAAGGSHGLALRSDGTVLAWGNNTYGQTSVPSGLSNAIAIAAGGPNSMALRSDGTVVVWGDNSVRQRNVPPALNGVVVGIATGGGPCLALTPIIAPRVQTLAATGFTTSGATLNASLNPEALPTTGYFRWGTTTNYGNVTPVTDQGSGSASVNFNSLITGLAPDTIYHFQVVASNLVGQVFGADASFRTAGAPFANTLPANGISSSGAVLNGMVSPNLLATTAWFEWGTNASYGNIAGVTDAPPTGGVVNLKSAISGLSPDFIYHYRLVATNTSGQAFGADQQFTLGRKLFGWGAYNCGQANIIVPPGLTGVVAAAGGYNHTLALKNDGTVTGWIGNPACLNFNNSRPDLVPAGLSNVIAIAAGDNQSLALRSDGSVVGWGANFAGQISVPVGLSNVIAIAAGSTYTLALRNDGTVLAWGGVGYQNGANVPADLNNIVAIAASGSSSQALKDDGTVVGWGANENGQTFAPASLGNVVTIAAGPYHSLGLKKDGTVVAWGGANFNGQMRVPPGLSNVVAIAAGIVHSLALKADGTVVAWGDNSEGQTNVPAALNNAVVGIAAGGYQSLAITPRTSPSVATLAASYASSSSVYFNGTVNPNELETAAWFRWGTSTNYGNVTAPMDLGNGSVDLNLTALASGLVTNTTYHFQVVASNALAAVHGADVSFTMSAPFITVQPQPLALYPGGTAKFSVAVGGLGPFVYQWMFNDTNVIAGATNSTYTLANVQFSDQGNYGCTITDQVGTITSTNAALSVVPIPSSGYVATVLADNPIAYWRLGETNGTIAHDYSGGHDGQYTNVTLGVPGFDLSDPDTAIMVGPGPNSYVANVQGIDFSSTPAFSLECWVNAPRRPYYDYNDAGIITKGTGNGGEQFDLDTGNSGGYRFFVHDPSGAWLGAAGSPLVGPSNTWQHLVAVYDGPAKQERLYVNGVMVGAASVSINGLLSTPHPVTIGSRQSSFSGGPYDFNFKGLIDEVAIYNYALSSNQVSAHFNAGTSVDAAQVVERLASAVEAGVSQSQPLLATLNAALASIRRGDSIPAVNEMLSFQNQVLAQIAPSDPTLAGNLTRIAQAVILALTGGHTNPSGRPHGLTIASMPRHEGHASLQFSGQPFQVYFIQVSTNLVDWQLIGVAADKGNGSFGFDDPSAPGFGNRFYQVITPP